MESNLNNLMPVKDAASGALKTFDVVLVEPEIMAYARQEELSYDMTLSELMEDHINKAKDYLQAVDII